MGLFYKILRKKIDDDERVTKVIEKQNLLSEFGFNISPEKRKNFVLEFSRKIYQGIFTQCLSV